MHRKKQASWTGPYSSSSLNCYYYYYYYFILLIFDHGTLFPIPMEDIHCKKYP